MHVGPSLAMAAAIEPEAAGSTAEARVGPLTVERLFRDHGEDVYRIASRTVLRYLRSWRRHRKMIEALESILEPAVQQPDQLIGDREVLGRVWACLLRIKPKKRLVYLLHEVEGLSGKEIAAALDV